MIGIIGSGSWATEIVHLLTRQSPQRIYWWVRDPEKATDLQNDHPRLRVTSDIKQVVEACDELFVVVPSAFLYKTFSVLSPEQLQGKSVISAVKGFVPETLTTVTQYFNENFEIPLESLCIISGPSHAEEVSRGCMTYLTVSSPNVALAEHVRELLDSDVLCTVYSDDMYGIECAAALKNIYAIVSGICYSLGYGDNLLGVLVSCEMREMAQFIERYVADGRERHMSHYIYAADMLATCYSQYSRNRTFGELIGRGYSPKEARLMQKMVAEGYYAVCSAEKILRKIDLELPVIQTLHRIIYKNHSVRREFHRLVRNLVAEHY